MADLLQRGASWLADRLQDQAAHQVVYERGASMVALQATFGSSLLKVDDGDSGVRMVRTDRDFIVRAADLVLGGDVVEPQRGDTVRETVGAAVHVYEVLAPPGEPEWRYSDQHRTILRIHAKRVAVEDL